MANACDVAAYAVERTGTISAMKMQKLVYYSQAWSLVWREKCLFEDQIEAWANGPVVRSLYSCHRGMFLVSPKDVASFGDPESLTNEEKSVVDRVVAFYGKWNAQQLSDLTHQERPWRKARDGVAEGEWSREPITPASMHEYYSGLSS